MTHEQFRDSIKESLKGIDNEKLDEFAKHIYYQNMDLKSEESFQKLSQTLRDLDEKYDTRGNKIFYLAMPLPRTRSCGDARSGRIVAREHENGQG